MNKLMATTAVLAASATTAMAGGIDRNQAPISILFQDGRYAELSFSVANPQISGNYSPTLTALGGGVSSTGNMAKSYSSYSLGYKMPLTDQLDLALIINQPYGADASYTEGFYTGLEATWDSTAYTALLKYSINDRMSVYGGPRILQSSADIAIPVSLGAPASDPDGAAALGGGPLPGSIASDYTAVGEQATDYGYVVGAAYEIPDIALRVALTYQSAITHNFDTLETYTMLGLPGPTFTPVSANTETEVEMPQSLTLDFQTGVAAGTLVFGSVRWTEWTAWEVRTPAYESETGAEIVSFDNDTITYQLGVGRRLSEEWSVFGRVTYEESKGGISSRLAPTDGITSLGIGGVYTKDNMTVRAGMEFARLGDAEDSTATMFEDNTAVGFGLTLGYRY